MKQEIAEIKASLGFISSKLMSIESKLIQQEENSKELIKKSPTSLSSDSNQLLIAELKSTRNTFELLRDEMVDLRQLIIVLFRERGQ